MTARRVAIFDFDGTIADSQAAAVAVYNEVAIRLRVPLITAHTADDPILSTSASQIPSRRPTPAP